MRWMKAGRPSTKVVEKKEDDLKYKKSELMLQPTMERAIVSLAAHVIKQWIDDGKPKKDFEGVKPWITIIKNYEEKQ